MKNSQISPVAPVLASFLAAALLVGAAPAEARKKPKLYATGACVADKQGAAASYCKKSLHFWADWEKTGDAAKRDQQLAKAAADLAAAWTKAEALATERGADCTDTTAAASTLGAFIDSAIGAIVDGVNTELDLGDPKDRQCGQKALDAAGEACGKIVKAESKFLKELLKKNARRQREGAQAQASEQLTKRIDKLVEKGCAIPPGSEVTGQVTALTDRITQDTINSPNVSSTQFDTIAPDGPVQYKGKEYNAVCMNGSPYAYFAKRGTTNKLLVYYQGGGACWEELTCSIPVCDDSVVTDASAGGTDNPNAFGSGFADVNNPDNPFRDWNVVFVSYCSCDIHFGDAAQDYDNLNDGTPVHVEHRGYQNAKIVEKWAREHFVAPDEVFVTGSSAGAYGAWFNGPLLIDVYPAASFRILADAGNGVVTQDFLETYFPNWNFEGNLPPDIPELKEVLDEGLGIPGYTEVVAREFPDTLWAHYTSAFDGGAGGQTGFYNLMLNDNEVTAALTWWEGSCAWNEAMREQAISTADAVPTNYRYYIGTGSRHTMWGSDKVYTDTTGGVPTLVDWVNGMLDSTVAAPDPAWSNVECTNCGLLLPGDVRPNPLAPPFTQVGSDVVIQCTASPSGAFVDGAECAQ
jgi:hypothetical protein